GADEPHARSQVGAHLCKESPAMLRGHYADHDFRIRERFFKALGGVDGIRNSVPGKKHFVDAPGSDRLADRAFMCPETHMVTAFSSESHGEGGAPGTSANDGDAAHPRPD